jgi:hypothetical protein
MRRRPRQLQQPRLFAWFMTPAQIPKLTLHTNIVAGVE